MADDRSSTNHRLELRDLFDEYFNLSDLQTLAFDLGLRFGNIAGDTQRNKFEYLIWLVGSQNRIPELIQLASEINPGVTWPAVDWSAVDWSEPPNMARWVIVPESTLEQAEQRPPAPGEPPFKGLAAFRPEDAPRFFGRDRIIATLVNRLQEVDVLAVVGASGSGKSSVVQAGVIPALTDSYRRDGVPLPVYHWTPIILTPTARPLDSLAAALFPEATADHLAARIAFRAELNQDSGALNQRLQKRAAADNGRVVLVIDQFEELFTQCKTEADRQTFIDQLQGITFKPTIHTKVILTLRADFYADCLRFDFLREVLTNQQEIVGAMNRAELQSAILQPAELGDWKIQAGLVELILDEVADEPGGLPLLSHALRETWERRRGRTMTLSGYREAGGVRGAIAETAETTFKHLTPKQQEYARRIFLGLTELGEGAQDTRRRARIDDLPLPAADDHDVAAVFDTLTRARLVTADKVEQVQSLETPGAPASQVDAYEVAHEALIREWPRLREWLDKSRDGLRLQRQISHEAAEWQANGQKADYLTLRGARLENALDIIRREKLVLPALATSFIEACQAAEAAERAEQEQLAREREEARQRELEQAEALAKARDAERVNAEKLAAEQARLAQEQAQRAEDAEAARQQAEGDAVKIRNRRNFALIGAGLAVTLALVAFYLFGVSNQNAQEAADNLDIANNALTVSAKNLELADIKATEAAANLNQADAKATEAAINLTLAEDAADDALIAQKEAEQQAQKAQTQALLASASSLLPAERNPTAEEASRSLLMIAQGLKQNNRLTDPVSSSLLNDQTRRLLNELQSRPIQTIIDREESSAQAVAFDPSGRWLASGGREGNLYMWDLANLSADPQPLIGHEANITAVAFDGAGRWLASSDAAGTLLLWNTADFSAAPQQLTGHEGRINTIAFDPFRAWLASGDGSGAIIFWDLSGEEIVSQRLEGHSEAVTSLAFHPYGRWLASGSVDRTVRLWSLADLTAAPQILEGHGESVTAVAFDPFGQRLASAGGDATFGASDDSAIRLWDLNDLEAPPTLLPGHDEKDSILSIAFDPTGRWLTSSGGSESPGPDTFKIRLWDMNNLSSQPRLLVGHDDWVFSTAFNTDGRWLASTGDGTIRLWQIDGIDNEPVQLVANSFYGQSLAFDLAGERLASAEYGQIVLWDVTDLNTFPFTIPVSDRWTTQVAFDPLNRWLVASSDDRRVRLWALDGSLFEPILTLNFEDPLRAMALDASGQWLAVSSGSREGSMIGLWALNELGEEPAQQITLEWSVVSLAFDPAGRWLAATGGRDGLIHLWDVNNWDAPPQQLENPGGYAGVIAFDPSGRWLAIEGANNTLMLWETSDWGKSPQRLDGHEDAITATTFDPTGRWLASASIDRTVRVWDLANLGEEPLILQGHLDLIDAVTFDPQGRWLASASWDGTIRLWRTLDELELFACEQAGRNFTWAEWEQFLPGQPYQKTCDNPEQPTADFPVDCSVLNAPEEQWPAQFIDEKALCAPADE